MKRLVFAVSSALAGVVGVVTSCGPVAAPSSPVSSNACPAHPCSAYVAAEPPTCSAGMCVSTAPLDFTLIVSLPESSFYAPGVTVPIPSFTAATLTQCTPPAGYASSYCVRIPSVVEPQGDLLVERSVIVAADAGAYIDMEDASVSQWSLPTQVQYRPLWPPNPGLMAPETYAEAASIGLPLEPVEATLFFPQASPFIGAPRGTNALAWYAPLAPGFYERDVVPDNGSFPAVTTQVAAASDVFYGPIPSADTLSVSVTRPSLSLAGFSAYLRDATTLRRISSEMTLGDTSSAQISLLTASPPYGPAAVSGSNIQVVVVPPDGTPIPYLADPLPPEQPTQVLENLPALYPPVTVSGTVRAPDTTPIAATLVIDSTTATGSAGGGIATVNPADPEQIYLHYSTSAQTDSSGRYSVTLPPGAYDVFVTPALGASAGAASVSLVVAPPLGSLPPVAAGKDLQAAALGILAGSAVIADGRPLAGATVQAQAAASLGATLDPRRWPRTQTTTTDASGAFAMFVDPGVYDIVVQPVENTGFPWTTLSSQVVAAGATSSLPPIVIPAPAVFDLVLQDPAGNAVVRGIVRAFANASSAIGATPGAQLPFIEIGRWLTDTNGHLTMLLAPPH